MDELRPGARLAGYRIEARIGEGSTGTVYSALDVALDRRVALKVLRHDLAWDVRFRERFLRESKLAASLEHPNIVPVHAVGESVETAWEKQLGSKRFAQLRGLLLELNRLA